MVEAAINSASVPGTVRIMFTADGSQKGGMFTSARATDIGCDGVRTMTMYGYSSANKADAPRVELVRCV